MPTGIHSPAHVVASPAWTLSEPVLGEAKQEGSHYLIPCGQSQVQTLLLPWAPLTQLFLFCLQSLEGFSASHAEPVLTVHANKGSGPEELKWQVPAHPDSPHVGARCVFLDIASLVVSKFQGSQAWQKVRETILQPQTSLSPCLAVHTGMQMSCPQGQRRTTEKGKVVMGGLAI